MANFPKELIYEILLYSPVKSLLRFKSVSKSFFSTISSGNFMNSHLEKSSEKRIRRNLIFLHCINDGFYNVRTWNINGLSKIPDEEFLLDIEQRNVMYSFYQVSASCNGLILLLVSQHVLCVWNPFTREYKNLPPCPVKVAMFHYSSLGFGYDSLKDDYKVLVIKMVQKRNRTYQEVWIFGFKSGVWRKIQDFPSVMGKVIKGGSNCFVDGALHFLCYGTQCNTCKIVAFDVAKENFKEASMPVCGITGFPKLLQVIEGCLCLCWCSPNSKNVEIYVRKRHGTDFTWSGLCSVKRTHGLSFKEIQVIGYSKDGDKILFLLSKQVCSYDLVTKQTEIMKDIQRVEIMNDDNRGSTILSCIESLVPINFSKLTRRRKRIDYRE